jgi:hypothetical protein
MKKLAAGLVVVSFVIFGAGGVYYWQYTKSPKYSLLRAKNAFEQHDLVSFEKYVDVEGITNSLIDQMLEIATEQEKPKDEWEQLGEFVGKGLVALLKPQLSKLAKQQIAKLVETGKLEEEQESAESNKHDFSLSDIWNKTGGEKAGFQGIEYIKKEGKIAYIGLKFFQKKYNTDLILDLKMRDKGGYWQVAEFSNFADYMKKIDELETKRIDELNAPIIEAIKKTLTVEEIRKRNKTDDWGIDKKVVFSVQVRNNGEKEIDRYKILLTCSLLDGKGLKSLNIVDDDNMLPGKTGGGSWYTDVNMFISGDSLLFDTPEAKLTIKADIQSIEFTDGTTLELYKKGQ